MVPIESVSRSKIGLEVRVSCYCQCTWTKQPTHFQDHICTQKLKTFRKVLTRPGFAKSICSTKMIARQLSRNSGFQDLQPNTCQLRHFKLQSVLQFQKQCIHFTLSLIYCIMYLFYNTSCIPMCCSWAPAVKSQGCILGFSFKDKINKLVCNMLCLIKACLTLSQRNTSVAKHTQTRCA